MKKHNAENERIKRRYFIYLKEAKRHSEHTVDAVAKALARFEEYNGYRDFKTFRTEQAVAFKNHLAKQNGVQSGKKLSKATLNATLANLKRFFQWLADQSGYKSRVKYTDADYFNLSENDARVATARREQKFPTIEQVKHVIANMPIESEIDKRNRALLAFTLLTGARDGAITSAKVKHIDLIEGSFYQDAREVNTKFRKTFKTFFFPVGDEIRAIVERWVGYLREEKLWGNDDPLFPATLVGYNRESKQFEVGGLKREGWSTASGVRDIFCEAFERVGLSYFNPHSFRHTLVQFGEQVCKTPEEFKVWSQNLGHENVLTTFTSYGEVAIHRQRELIRNLSELGHPVSDVEVLAEAVARRIREINGK